MIKNKWYKKHGIFNAKESVNFYQDVPGFKLEIAVPDGTNSIENEISDAKEYSTAMMKKMMCLQCF